jgi:hypothetical protein
MRYWGKENPRELHERLLHSHRVTVRCAISRIRIVGSHFSCQLLKKLNWRICGSNKMNFLKENFSGWLISLREDLLASALPGFSPLRLF